MSEERSPYDSFLATKRALRHSGGKTLSAEALNSILFAHQRQLTTWALQKGRAALFCDTGLGKTFMQLEWAKQIGERTLILAPLAVAYQTVREGDKLGIEVQYVRSQHHLDMWPHQLIYITNYEMVEHFNPASFGAVILDESSILKSIDGKTRSKLIEMFRATPYRLCCTATPAPNDIAEFANHAEFLGICTREEMLSMFFVHDETGWRLKGHAQNAFYRWMASWAMMVKTPSDIGFSDDGYILPPLSVSPVWIEGDAQKAAAEAGQLFLTGLEGIRGRSVARRVTIADKIAKATAILNASDERWIVWCILNEEGQQLAKLVNDSVLVEGKDSPDSKTQNLISFLEGCHRVLITKASIAGHGLNLQNCHNMMFIGLTDSWEAYYHAIRREWRYGQQSPVNVQIVLSDLEAPILENIQRKEAQALEVGRQMVEAVSGYQQEELGILEFSQNGYHEAEQAGAHYTLLMGDCVERMKELPAESVDFSVFSPPFLSLYVYTDSERDMGNSRNEAEFFEHYGYMLQELYRIGKPGRLTAVHVAQVATKLVTDGHIGLRDFRGKVIAAFEDRGFHYHGDITVDKNPQAQAIRTHAKGLLFKQLRSDASWLRPGLADYILLFRKPGENAVPIHPDISNNEWIEWAHPVWYGIRESDTLHAAEGRAQQDERHVAPLQLGVIKRCIRLWSNPGEMVFSPFAGIGSEGYQAILLGRRFIGIELKESYYNAALKNLEAAVTRTKQGILFSMIPHPTAQGG